MSWWQWYLVLFALAFAAGPLGLRTLIIWRATGRNPLLIEPLSTPYGRAQLAFKAVLVGCAAVGAVHFFAPGLYAQLGLLAPLQHDAVRAAGVVLSLSGLVLTWLAQSAMGLSWRFGPDREGPPPLVTGGVFAVIRNPIYTSMLLAEAGVVLLLPTVATVALFVAGVLATRALVRMEESFLRGVHGEAYEAYLARTGRFLPRLTATHQE